MPRSRRSSRRNTSSISKSRDSNRCPSGYIERVGYQRKGYYRRPYRRTTGEEVKGSYVDPTYVPSTCIYDRGYKGHGPYTLPSIDGGQRNYQDDEYEEIHLRDYGYSVHDSAQERHRVLDEASQDYGYKRVLRHLLLRANYQSYPESYKRMHNDVKYLSDQYAGEKGQDESRYYGSKLAKQTKRQMENKLDYLREQQRQMPTRSSRYSRTSRSRPYKRSKSRKSNEYIS